MKVEIFLDLADEMFAVIVDDLKGWWFLPPGAAILGEILEVGCVRNVMEDGWEYKVPLKGYISLAVDEDFTFDKEEGLIQEALLMQVMEGV